MKKLVLSSILVIAGLSVHAQKVKTINLPVAVQDNFNKLYPEIVSVEWELEEGNYEGAFKKNKVKTEVLFNAEGKLLQTETKLNSVNDLPALITASLKKDFKGYEFEEAEQITTAEGQEQYSVDAELKETEYELLYDKKGVLLKKTEEKEKKEKEEREKANKKKNESASSVSGW